MSSFRLHLQTCPLLLRVFLSNGRHHMTNEYGHGNVPANELQIYTWLDATLKELTGLVKEVNPEARRKGTIFEFGLVAPDPNPRGQGYRMREVGSTCTGQRGVDDSKTLSAVRFQIGDYLDIAITPPHTRPNHGPGGYGGGPGNYGGGPMVRRPRPY